jgi:hypothetical protein
VAYAADPTEVQRGGCGAHVQLQSTVPGLVCDQGLLERDRERHGDWRWIETQKDRQSRQTLSDTFRHLQTHTQTQRGKVSGRHIDAAVTTVRRAASCSTTHPSLGRACKPDQCHVFLRFGVGTTLQLVCGHHLHIVRAAHQVPALPPSQQRHAERQGGHEVEHGCGVCTCPSVFRMIVDDAVLMSQKFPAVGDRLAQADLHSLFIGRLRGCATTMLHLFTPGPFSCLEPRIPPPNPQTFNYNAMETLYLTTSMFILLAGM